MAKAETDEMVDEIERDPERLADTVDALIDRTNPRSIARRSLSTSDPLRRRDGSPRFGTIVPLVAGTVAVVAGIVVIRRLSLTMRVRGLVP